MKKALVLLSGGLDSALAAKLMLLQGVRVHALCFTSPFFGDSRAKKVAKELGITIDSIDISEKMLHLLKRPEYGFGKGANPCIDCHLLMVREAASFMKRVGAEFVVTGEVLGERSKSQTRAALRIIEEKSGIAGLILRPLSARFLAPTKVEEKGWVRRENLLRLHGRSRKEQLSLAKEWGLKHFGTPAGGCLLTDPFFSKRVKDLFLHSDPNVNDLWLLRCGRHFRLDDLTKLVVSRNQREEERIRSLLLPSDILLRVKEYKGPLGLVRGSKREDVLIKAASIVARYSAARQQERVQIECSSDGGSFSFWVKPCEQMELMIA